MANLIKIGFVLLSSAQNPIPSTRIAVLNILPYLRAAQFDPHIVFEPCKNTETPDLSSLHAENLKDNGYKIIFFQKVYGDSVVKLARALGAIGIKTVFGVCDRIEPQMAAATDATVTVTDYLKSLYPSDLQARISTVHDGIERPGLHKSDWGDHRGSRTHPLRAVLVTSAWLDHLPVLDNPPSWLKVTVIGRYNPSKERWQNMREDYWHIAGLTGWREKLRFLRFIFNPRIQRLPWDANGVYAAMQSADIGIIPIETAPERVSNDSWQVKSENRLTLKMSIGLPVIATPIPAYLPVVEQGQNAFLAQDRTEWMTALDSLRDPALRSKIGQQARQTAQLNYSIERQAEKLIKVLHELLE